MAVSGRSTFFTKGSQNSGRADLELPSQRSYGYSSSVEADGFLDLLAIEGRSSATDLMALEVLKHSVAVHSEPDSQLIHWDALVVTIDKALNLL
jgi:hypothetical protein